MASAMPIQNQLQIKMPIYKTPECELKCFILFIIIYRKIINDMTQSTDCSSDRLLISKYGDSALIGAEEYCGETSLDILSISNWISVGNTTQS